MDDELALAVYAQRKRLGLTQQQLAERAGVTRQSVIALEAGDAKTMRWETIEKIIEASSLHLRVENAVGKLPASRERWETADKDIDDFLLREYGIGGRP